MIAVIADDLTGAAEIGGLALRIGLTVEIAMEVNGRSAADVLIISTDTRSVNEDEARNVIAKVAAQLDLLQPTLLFKKIDSVLRGHVLKEIEVVMNILGFHKALVVPANPTLGRTIVDGIYYFNGQPVHLSSFANDPEFAVKSSDINDMLRANDTLIYMLKPNDNLPDNGIIVGEVSGEQDLDAWASKLCHHTLLVGGGDFFKAMMEQTNKPLKKQVENRITNFNSPALFVCGTTFHKTVHSIHQIKLQGGPVSYMPLPVILFERQDRVEFEQWADEICNLLSAHGKVIVAINGDAIKDIKVSAVSLRQKMAIVVNKVIAKAEIKELFIEGGSTAASIINILGVTHFFPAEELVRGVIRMRAEGLQEMYITVKPGSYDWPPGIWDFDH
jgi:uncharacterized protein YgbK (DUF1537 family)